MSLVYEGQEIRETNNIGYCETFSQTCVWFTCFPHRELGLADNNH